MKKTAKVEINIDCNKITCGNCIQLILPNDSEDVRCGNWYIFHGINEPLLTEYRNNYKRCDECLKVFK